MTAPAPGARLVTTIVCAFGGELPTAQLAVFHRFEKRIARTGLRIRVRLFALDELPERFEILVVPPDLAERAPAVARGARIIVATRDDAPALADQPVQDLESGSAIYAEPADPHAPKIVTHRGMEEL